MKTSNNNSEENTIKIFDDIEVLKQLAKTWRYFSNFRLSCMKLEKTEELLSILSTISSAKEFKAVELFGNINTSLPEFKVIEELWGEEYSAHVLEKILILFGFDNAKNLKLKESYNSFIINIKNTDIDPILKFVAIYSYTFKYLYDNRNLMRIVSMFIFKNLSLVSRPILYPLDFIYSTEIQYLNKESAIIILKTFEHICQFGEYTINLVDDNMKNLQSNMAKIKELRKFSTSKYFYYLFSKLYITIADFMKDLNIKRDKAARLLAKLVKLGYFRENKLGKEKVFINMYMVEFLKGMNVKKQAENYIKQ